MLISGHRYFSDYVKQISVVTPVIERSRIVFGTTDFIILPIDERFGLNQSALIVLKIESVYLL